MPRTIDEGFKDFLAKLTPDPNETESAKSHRASIEVCLKNNLELTRFFRTGSFGNGTSISGYSDVDYFASIPRRHLTQNSTSILNRLRQILQDRFPSTGAHVDCPAVKLPFAGGEWEKTEVVPADYIKKTESGHLIYEIPDCSGAWMRSSPDAHNAYVRRINEKLGYKVKPLIRFIKAWKYYQNVPVSSFYLELRVAKYSDGESAIIYDLDIKRVFKHLLDIGLARLQDPMGISGYIYGCDTQSQVDETLSKLETALSRANKALEEKDKGNSQDSFYWWNLLFNGNFPSYYR